MHFIAQIEHHLANFETVAREEIERFVEHLKSKFVEPGAPVPSAVTPVVAPAAEAAPVAPVEVPPAPEAAPVAAPTVDTGAVV